MASKKNPRNINQNVDDMLAAKAEDDVYYDAIFAPAGPPVKKNAPYTEIAIDDIAPYHNHPFALYEGERLEDLVASIRKDGVLVPCIVRKLKAPTADGCHYEMLAGHNRQNGARLAGLSKIPCIIKENLSDEEADIYVIKSNLIQQGISDWKISVRIKVFSQHLKMVSENRQKEIENELKSLEKNYPQNVQKSHDEAISEQGGNGFHLDGKQPEKSVKSRDKVGTEYALSGRMIAMYVQMANLIPEFIAWLDDGNLTIRSGVELSYLSQEEQKAVHDVLTKTGVKPEESLCKKLRAASGNLNADKISEIIVGKKGSDKEPNLYKSLKDEFPEQFRRKGKKQMNDIIRAALTEYFANHRN